MRAKHEMAGQTVVFNGNTFALEDWWENVGGDHWFNMSDNFACMEYKQRLGKILDTDTDVVYGKMNGLGYIIHDREWEKAEYNEKTWPDAEGNTGETVVTIQAIEELGKKLDVVMQGQGLVALATTLTTRVMKVLTKLESKERLKAALTFEQEIQKVKLLSALQEMVKDKKTEASEGEPAK